MILEVEPKATVEPRDLNEALGMMRAADAAGETLSFAGGGTELDLGYPPWRVDTLVKTQSLGRVVDYTPADMTVTVEAGVTLAALQRVVAEHGQRLAIDPPQADQATIGGLLATNASGPLRARYGTFRDLIVGVSLIRADGTRARGGGKVVKNVAGFDLPKLMVGSLGTLAMIATATLRLHPLPAVQRWLVVQRCSAQRIGDLMSAIVAWQLEPAAIMAVFDGDGYGYHLCVLFEGFAQAVERQAERFTKMAGDANGPVETLDDAQVEIFDAYHAATRSDGDLRVKLMFLPSQIAMIDRLVLSPMFETLANLRVAMYPSVGVGYVGATVLQPESAADALRQARDVIEQNAGRLILSAAPPAVRARIDVYGALPASFPIMQQLKDRFDPNRRLNPGRFVGGL